MEEKEEKQIQERIICEFNGLMDAVRDMTKEEDRQSKFLALLNYTEKIELPNIRKVCSMQVIQMKRRLNIKGDYEFTVII